MVEVYVQRLVGACDLLRTIDTGDYPFKEYSSGEVSRTKRVYTKDGWEEREEYASLPIFPKDKMKGLRFAVCKTIFETRELFYRWDVGQAADEVINERKR